VLASKRGVAQDLLLVAVPCAHLAQSLVEFEVCVTWWSPLTFLSFRPSVLTW
jgi:hypothetical protein